MKIKEHYSMEQFLDQVENWKHYKKVLEDIGAEISRHESMLKQAKGREEVAKSKLNECENQIKKMGKVLE